MEGQTFAIETAKKEPFFIVYYIFCLPWIDILCAHTMKVPLFKFRCNIFIGVRIIKEMPGSVASGTHCIYSDSVICSKFPPKII